MGVPHAPYVASEKWGLDAQVLLAHHGGMKLTHYLKERGITDRAFADLIGKERSLVTRYRHGSIIPPIEVIADIREQTGGLVSFEDFLEEGRKPQAKVEAAA